MKSSCYTLRAIPTEINNIILDEQARKRLEKKCLKDKESVIYSIIKEWDALKKTKENGR